MKEIIRYSLVLSLICVVASASLAGVNALTKSQIANQTLAEEEKSLKEVLPDAVSFEAIKKDNETIYYKAFDAQGKSVGCAFKASGKGYSSVIETICGMLPDGTINAIKVINQNETPGLGSQVSESEFTSMFRGRQDLSEIQAITGATISSRAVINSVHKKAQEIKKILLESAK